ncbi:MAG: zf-HC2 domain-containing protein [Verrucomicrobiota bacterium]
MKALKDQIWAYLHNELAPDERARFERALQGDADLREALEERRQTHRELENILPILDKGDEGDDQLEERLIAEWESEHPEYAEVPIRKPRRRILYFSLPLAAAAAAAVLLLALSQKPIHWERTSYGSAPRLRGQPVMEPRYTRAELKQVDGELQETIEAHLEQLAVPSRPWTLKIHIQELVGGALTVEIAGHPRKTPEVSEAWNRSFQSLENFRGHVPEFGKQVAEDLAERNIP